MIRRLITFLSVILMLPTEAEWEYACRAGTTTVYSWGDTITPENANYFDSYLGPQDVGKYARILGVFDMHGNHAEWTEDRYANYSTTAQIGLMVQKLATLGSSEEVRSIIQLPCTQLHDSFRMRFGVIQLPKVFELL